MSGHFFAKYEILHQDQFEFQRGTDHKIEVYLLNGVLHMFQIKIQQW